MPSSKNSNQAFSRIFTHELLKRQTMVNIARTIPGVLGERMLGGGDKAPLFSKIDWDSGTVVDLEMNFTPKLSWNIWNIGLVWDNDG